MAPRIVVACALVLVVACGGKKGPPPLSADEANASSEDGGSDPSSSSDSDGGSGGGSASTDPPASTTPGPVSCLVSSSVCSETTLAGKDASDAKDRCKAASGEPKDGECSHDDVVATCSIPGKNVMMYYYKDKDPAATRGLIKGGKGACKNAGGTFTPTAKPAGGKKPKKK